MSLLQLKYLNQLGIYQVQNLAYAGITMVQSSGLGLPQLHCKNFLKLIQFLHDNLENLLLGGISLITGSRVTERWLCLTAESASQCGALLILHIFVI